MLGYSSIMKVGLSGVLSLINKLGVIERIDERKREKTTPPDLHACFWESSERQPIKIAAAGDDFPRWEFKLTAKVRRISTHGALSSVVSPYSYPSLGIPDFPVES